MLKDKQTIKTISNKHLQMANELEFISDGDLWANVYGKDCIARINPHTGKVFSWVLGHNLREHIEAEGEVFNGIAWDQAGERLFVTGKLWSKVFEVKVVPLAKDIPKKDLSKFCVPVRNMFH